MNWKQRILLFITGLGTLLAGLGTLPVDSADLPMPQEWRPYILSIGLFAVTISKWLPILGDILDDGKVNQSFKIGMWLLVVALVLSPIVLLTGCEGLSVSALTPYGNVSTDANGNITIAPRPVIIPAK